MAQRKIRIVNTSGGGWITVGLQAALEVEDRLGAIIEGEGIFPQAVGPDYIHPEDYKILVEQFEEDNTKERRAAEKAQAAKGQD